MWKKGERAWDQRRGASTGEVEKTGGFSTDLVRARFSTEEFSFSTGDVGNRLLQRLELMLVLISFTVSAKAGSFFIFFSICWME